MKISRDHVFSALSKITLPNGGKNIIESGAIKNVQVFGNDIEIDVEVSIPALQYKKRVEKDCIDTVSKHISDVGKIKINISVKAPEKNIEIKGSSIPGVKNIVAISSAKGGVGKSTIAANFAVGLSTKGFKVGVIDADIYGPSMHIMFGLQGSEPMSINVAGRTKIKPLEAFGVKLLSIGFFASTKQAVVWRGPMASKALNQLLWDTYWGELDYLVVDLPPGTGDIHLSLVQSIPLTGAVVVSTPQDIALADVKKGVNMFQMKSINVPVIGVVENMSYFTPKELPNNKYYIFGKDGLKVLADQMQLNLLAEIPLVQSVREASDAGRPAVLQNDTSISLSYLKMTDNIISAITKRNTNLAPTKAVKLTNTKGCQK